MKETTGGFHVYRANITLPLQRRRNVWLKYSNREISKSDYEDRPQSVELGQYTKPCGCWITDDSEDCWRSWCVGERFGLEDLTHKHEVVLDETDILILRSALDVAAFSDRFGAAKWWGPDHDLRKWRDWCIDWQRVAAEHSGIIIAPYQWSLRLADGFSWYYGWDCASGCIWRASAIKEIRLIEVDQEIAKPRKDDAA